MKILFIAPNYLPHIGGVERHLENLTQELLKDGHQVTIVVQKFENSYLDYEESDALKIIRIRKRENRVLRRLYLLSYMLRDIREILKYDLIHFHDYSTFWSYALLVYPLLKLFGKKIFITFHGWEGSVPPKKSIILKRQLITKMTRANLSIGHFIEKWYGTKADIVSYGGVSKATNLKESREEYALFIGRLAPDTGLFEALKAWRIFSKKNPTLEFVICGDGVLREEIEEYIKVHQLQKVLLKGFISNVQEYVKNAKIVFTSGYLGILEAFSYKKNVIAIYDNELKKDYLTLIPEFDAMMWVVNSDEKSIIRALKEALTSSEKKEKAYQYALKNSWQKVKEDYYRLWQI